MSLALALAPPPALSLPELQLAGTVIPFAPFALRRRASLLGALDIGHDKIFYLLANQARNIAAPPQLVGFGEVEVREKCWQYPDYFRQAVQMAMQAAEEMAGGRAKRVIVSSSSLAPQCDRRAGHISVGGMIDDAAYARLLRENYDRFDDDTRAMLHAIVLSCTMDEEKTIRDPRGLKAEQLRMAMLGVSVPHYNLNRLDALLQQAHIDVEKYVVPAYANALSVLAPDNIESGYLTLDIGAKRSNFALHSRGGVIHIGELPLGGWHISSDIAQVCELPFAVAERAKRLFGNALGRLPDSAMRYENLLPGEADSTNLQENYMIDCVAVSEVIRPRVEELLEMVVTEIKQAGLEKAKFKQVVLCGGGAELAGLPELVRAVLGKKASLAPKALVAGQYEISPRHSVGLGLLRYLQQMEHHILPSKTFAWREFLDTEKLKNAFYKWSESVNP